MRIYVRMHVSITIYIHFPQYHLQTQLNVKHGII